METTEHDNQGYRIVWNYDNTVLSEVIANI